MPACATDTLSLGQRRAGASLPLLAVVAGLAWFAAVSPALSAEKIEIVAAPEPTPGNIAVAEDGTVIVTEHPSSKPSLAAFAVKDGKVTPFPNAEAAKIVADGGKGFHPVLGIRVSKDGMVWMLSGNSGQKVKYLYGWDLKANRLAQ